MSSGRAVEGFAVRRPIVATLKGSVGTTPRRILFNEYFYIRESALRVHSLTAADALAAATFAPSGRGASYTAWANLDCYVTVRRTCAPQGDSSGGGTAPEVEASGSNLTRSCASPKSRTASNPPRIFILRVLPSSTKSIFSSKGSVW